MDTSKLKRFAQFARRSLIEQVTSRLNLVLQPESMARREYGEAIATLEKEIKASSKEQVIDRVAYVWFNRFCALRFMDVNRYTKIGVLSPAEGQFQPEILAEAKMGHIDEETVPQLLQKKIFALLDGSAPSPNAQTEAYGLLVVAACNGYHKAMPYLFERIDDYTELLMPDDLLSGNSILAYTREAMTPDACKDVEVLGWLYQFYISEKKDAVFTDLKKNKKITPENIPAATQLFTPHWIVRYLVENSLGRLWLLNHPKSRLIEQMEYYIQPEQAETDFLRISKPEEIKICDPACGSGHMLVYAFDLLYAIYEEEGYEPSEIPEKILTHNLYGIEIDERAGELAAFALTMKAREKQRRFFRKPVQPNICVLEAIQFEDGELKDYMDFIGRDLFTAPLLETLHQFREADNFGSLIRPTVTDVGDVLVLLEEKDVEGQLFLHQTHQKVLKVLRQVDYLSSKYHVVIANPPYMGNGNMNKRLGSWASKEYPHTKYDLYAMFIVRTTEILILGGYSSLVTLQNWMFLSRLEKLRVQVSTQYDIQCFMQVGFNSFPELNSKVSMAAAYTLRKGNNQNSIISFVDLNSAPQSADKNLVFFDKKVRKDYLFSQNNITKIPGHVFLFSASNSLVKTFSKYKPLSAYAVTREGMATGNNDRFLRYHYEVSHSAISFDSKVNPNLKWFPYVKGGGFRKWSGNTEVVVNWHNDGEEIRSFSDPETGRIRSHNLNGDYAFKEGLTWTGIGIEFGARAVGNGFMFDAKGPMAFLDKWCFEVLAFLNSKVAGYVVKRLAASLDFKIGQIFGLPFPVDVICSHDIQSVALVDIGKTDWDSYENSWEFTRLPMLNSDYRNPTLKATYQKLHAHWREITLEMRRLEEENNRIFIEAYGLQDELTPDVPLKEITLTCNPHYRYGGNKTEDELDHLLLADTMREFISYAVGCMFGRYSLDKPGLILANQGETIEDYLQQISTPTFPADTDNVIPLLDGDWFPDDISERFRKFLRVTFGEEHYDANLKFIEKALGKDIRKYFLRDFYNDHISRYKKRPIYWLFSSPKGTFNALIYLHRYRPDTVSIVLNDYLREFRTKLTAHKTHLEAVSIDQNATQSEKTKALKTIENLRKIIDELEKYERDILYPLAIQQLAIDLDDGVKVNYVKFGAALKKIAGLETAED
jgi:type II restriction/modification system DNA methylase subunit YeeA